MNSSETALTLALVIWIDASARAAVAIHSELDGHLLNAFILKATLSAWVISESIQYAW